MTAKQRKRSPHRHISFTAHYTGYIWYEAGLSHPALASQLGRRLVQGLRLLENWADDHVGSSMRRTLLTRHRLIDERVDQWLAVHPTGQIVELACGLSPRGWRYRRRFPNLTYLEADLPQMAAQKQAALAKLGDTSTSVEAVDLFTSDPEQGLTGLMAKLDPTRPVLVITEGLINYFSKTMHQRLWRELATALKAFPSGRYLSEINPEPIRHPMARTIWYSSRLLRWLSRSAFAFHYVSPVELTQVLQTVGFQKVEIIQPSQVQQSSDTHLGDLVWIIQADV